MYLLLVTILMGNPASDVLTVFKVKCAGCHGTSVADPEGDPPFGYVDDLKKLASDTTKVKAGDPDNSDLWKLVTSGNMPPRDSDTGTLSADEKAIIRTWITTGAPVDLPPPVSSALPVGQGSAPSTGQSVGVQTPQPAPSVSVFHRSMKWMGKWHLLTLHFPIALIVAAAGRELWSMYRRTWEVDNEVRFTLIGAALSGVIAATLGWLHAYNGAGGGSPNLAYHRWFGTAAAILVASAAYLSEVDAKDGKRSILTRVMIFTNAGLVGLAAHYGGKMVHGSTFMDW